MKPPLPNSYWVEPGRLLAGEHPGRSGAGTAARLEALVAAGVRSFIDLTQSHEMAAYRELLPADVVYENFAMADHALPDSPAQMRAVQRAVEQGMQRGVVYIHCRAGIGRTGVAVGCYLREQGEPGLGALRRLNRLWQQNALAASWPTIPETEAQEEYVRDWQARTADTAPLQRHRGCLLTLAAGDALGSAPPGTAGVVAWADDTGMTLCVAESLLACGGFDARDQLQRYRAWDQDAVAAGAAPGATLRPSVRSVVTRSLLNRSAMLGSHDPAQLDAAPLARSAAAALFAAGQPDRAAALAADAARVTHQAPMLVDACRLLAGMISQALAGVSREILLRPTGAPGGLPLRDEVLALAAGWTTPPAGRRKPPVAALGVLDRAVRCFARSRSIGDGMARALDSPGGDRDSICAVYGALAGAYYGDDALEPALRNRVALSPRLDELAEALYRHGRVAHGIPA